MGEVRNLVDQQSVDAAWLDYADDAKRLSVEPHLLADRAFNERLARKHERWRKLFLFQDGH